MNWGQLWTVLCPEGNGRLNELGEFQASSEGHRGYLSSKFIQFNTWISLKKFPFCLCCFCKFVLLTHYMSQAWSPGSLHGVPRGLLTFDLLVAWVFIHWPKQLRPQVAQGHRHKHMCGHKQSCRVSKTPVLLHFHNEFGLWWFSSNIAGSPLSLPRLYYSVQ